ncbi:MAG TPA: threonine/serine exporter, partial [Paraprevotella xylaniphila]|nr:threonine/serine exporter [Paraprevotella xylaniphila]
MTNSTTTNHKEALIAETDIPATPKDACIFLSDYAAWLLGCGATCIRIEKNVKRMADRWNMVSEMTILPSHIHMTVWNDDRSHSYSNIVRLHHTGISFDINTQLSKLSWAIADRKIGFAEAQRNFEAIVQTRPANPWMVWILASLANMAFCRLFGGDFIAMAIVLTGTLAGYKLKQVMLEDRQDVRFVFFCCAFFSSVIGAAG